MTIEGGLSIGGLAPGDAVLAHWTLPSGDRSDGVEDATVLAVDLERELVWLRYVDGLQSNVPLSWVVQMQGRHAQRKAGDSTMAALLHSGAKEEDAVEAAADLAPAARSVLHVTPADGADYSLQRLLQRGAPLAEICARVRTLCSRPNGAGLQPLTSALRFVLSKPGPAQNLCLEALCILCNSCAEDAALARLYANAILLSGSHVLPCTARQLALLRKSKALSKVQLSKLEVLFQEAPRWRPFTR